MKFKVFSKNLSYLSEKSFEDLWKYNSEKLSKLTPEITIYEARDVVRLDPTTIQNQEGVIQKIGNYSEWLLTKIYAKLTKEERLKFMEDKRKVRETLDVFNRNKARIQIKDINQYKTFKDLEDVANQYSDILTRSKQVEKREKETEIFYDEDDSDYIIKIPQTKYAACLLGKGTTWCTAAENNNRFAQYTNKKDRHLYVIINKKDPEKKYQFSPFNRELRDASDDTVAWSDIGLDDSVFWKMVDNDKIESENTEIDSTDNLQDAITRVFFNGESEVPLIVGKEPVISFETGREELHVETIPTLTEIINDMEKYFGDALPALDQYAPKQVKEKFKKELVKSIGETLGWIAENNRASDSIWRTEPRISKDKVIFTMTSSYYHESSTDEPDYWLSEGGENFDIRDEFYWSRRSSDNFNGFLLKEEIKRLIGVMKQLNSEALVKSKEQLSFFHPSVQKSLGINKKTRKFKDVMK